MAVKKSSVISVLIKGDNKGLSNSLDDSSSRLASFGKSAGVAIAAVGAAVGAAAFVIGKKAVDSASDLEESINAVSVAFGDASEAVLKIGETSAVSMGVSRREFNAAAVRFSAFAERVVGEGGDVGKFIDDVSVRAADFASVFNIEVSEALGVFQSGLAGEAEPLKRFGINLLQAEVQTYALEAGIIAAGEQMTEQDKVQARYGLLMQETAKTAGDFANTSDGLANSQRILKARVDDVLGALGGALLPAVGSLVGAVGDRLVPAFERFAEWFKRNEPAITAFGDRVLGGVSTAVGFIGEKFAEIRGPIETAVAFVGTKAAEFKTFFDERLKEPVEAVGTAIATFVTNAKTRLGEFAGEVPGAVKAFTDFLSEVRGLADDPQKLGERLGDALSTALKKAFEEISKLSSELNTAIRDLLAKVDFFGIGRSAVTALIQFGLGFATAFLGFEWLEPVLTVIRENLGTILLAAIGVAFAPAKIAGRLTAIFAKIPFVGRLLGFLVKGLQAVGDKIKLAISTFFGAFGQAFGVSLGRIGPGLISRFTTFLTGLPRAVGSAFDDMVVNASTGFARFGTTIGNAVGRLIINFRTFMSNLLRPFTNFGRTLADDLYNIGRNVIDALIRGIGSMAGRLTNAVRGIGSSMRDTLSRLWKISSPSKVFMNIGEDAMQGLALGLAGSERMLRGMTTDIGLASLPSVDVSGQASGQGQTYVTINVSGADPQAVVEALRRYTRANGPLGSVVSV